MTDYKDKSRTLFETPWLTLHTVEYPEMGIGGYVYSHEKRCNGRIIAVLPNRVVNGVEEFLIRREITPCWGLKHNLSAITGGWEGGDPVDDVIRELKEEAGYDVHYSEVVSLGQSYASKSSDTIYDLFTVNLTDKIPGVASGDGSSLEANADCVWLSYEEAGQVRDPQVGLMLVRPFLGDTY